jgi:hypothetical protein
MVIIGCVEVALDRGYSRACTFRKASTPDNTDKSANISQRANRHKAQTLPIRNVPYLQVADKETFGKTLIKNPSEPGTRHRKLLNRQFAQYATYGLGGMRL